MSPPRGQKQHSSTPSEQAPAAGKVRLQRFMADAGVASRRECERMIEEGFVEVNGEVMDKLPVFINPGKDRVSVNGRIVDKKAAKADRIYLALYKPDNTLTTTRDSGVEDESNSRRTVLDLIDNPATNRLIVVGRLGFHATGLVLLTNDGQLAQRLSHAKFGVTKTYRITVKGTLHPEALHSLRERFCPASDQLPAYLLDEDGQAIDPLRIVRESTGTTTIELVMRAGAGAGGGMSDSALSPGATAARAGKPLEPDPRAARPRRRSDGADESPEETTGEINTGGGMLARMLTRMGNPVKRLERIAIGPLKLRFLSPEESRRLTKDEVQSLMEATGLARPTGTRPEYAGGGRNRPIGKGSFVGRGRPEAPKPKVERSDRAEPRRSDPRNSRVDSRPPRPTGNADRPVNRDGPRGSSERRAPTGRPPSSKPTRPGVSDRAPRPGRGSGGRPR